MQRRGYPSVGRRTEQNVTQFTLRAGWLLPPVCRRRDPRSAPQHDVENLLGALVDGPPRVLDGHLGVGRRLVRIADPGERRDLPAPRRGVEALAGLRGPKAALVRMELRSATTAHRWCWDEALASWRNLHDRRETPRADSATARILGTLQEHPVLTASSVARLFDVSRGAAARALDELSEAGVLTRRRLDGRTSAYLAMDVFELITFAERRLASTRRDTGRSRPSRPAPCPTAR